MNATMTNQSQRGPHYRWGIVGLLWTCGFFNYADRQAIASVFPLLKDEYHLTETELGMLGSSFMVLYALASPLTGFVVDWVSRRLLIVSGLAFWSLICAATGLARSFGQLLFFRAAEGLGESFYFPASVSMLADYHGPKTRSRALSLHQTSVYVGTAGGGALAGWLAERHGWRSPFWLLGLTGFGLAIMLSGLIREPKRGGDRAENIEEERGSVPAARPDWLANLRTILRVPSAVVLLAAFAGANFVAMALIYWLPLYVKAKFSVGVASAAFNGTVPMQMASLAGAVVSGALADWAARRSGGRMRVQGIALLLGAPCALAAGWTGSLDVLIAVLIGVGFCKGAYDANIFASVYDVVPAEIRGTAAGLMNTIGWVGGSLGPYFVGFMSDHANLSLAIASTAAVYLVAGLLALLAAQWAPRRSWIEP
jgi:MFS family permease